MNPSPEPARPRRGDGHLFDLLVRGGEVIDLGNGRRERCDVALADGRIARVAPDIERVLAAEVVDARGAIVVPGLVDLHTHIYFSATFWGIDPRPVAWRTGVTTWVDAGSAGAYNLAALHQLCLATCPWTTRAFVNISSIGLVAETGEARREDLCDPGLCTAAIMAHRDFVIGVKCRLDRASVGDMGLVPLRRAVEAAGAAGVPVMAHIGGGPPDIDDALDLLRPGDLVTHCATGQSMSMVGGNGKLRSSAVRAHERGVLFDVGHGSGGFSFAVAEAMLAEGVLPDVISSDVHQRSLLGPAFDLPTCMSKFLALGVPLEDVLRAATVNPSRVTGDSSPAGAIEVGKPADLAVFELVAGDFALYDTYLERRPAPRLLVNRATIVGGALLAPVPAAPPAHWIALTERQRSHLSRPAPELRFPWAASLSEPEAYVRLALEGPPNVGGIN
ncbi:MAG: amidohydrolase/deacetylase family metallohydrolase [Acidimicrobiales bacterium]